jgi:hypothetical protein
MGAILSAELLKFVWKAALLGTGIAMRGLLGARVVGWNRFHAAHALRAAEVESVLQIVTRVEPRLAVRY